MSRRLTVLSTVALVLAFAAPAHAGWLPAQAVDGPNASVLSVGGVDVARDGTGAIGYLRLDGGVPVAFVSRLSGGVWRAPERLDPAGGGVTDVKVAAGDGNRLAVAWIADGVVYANVAPGGSDQPGAFAGPVALSTPGATALDLDMGVNGAAYAIWEQGGDVKAARLQDTAWTPIAPVLDIQAAADAGRGAGRPKIAVSAEGYAVATWGEQAGDGLSHVWARRLTGVNLSVAPQDLTLPGGAADSPDIDVEDDGSFAWVVFRQDQGGVSHTFGRRLIGSLFEAPEQLDGGSVSSDPRVDLDGRGLGAAVSTGGSVSFGSVLDHDHFLPGARLDATGSVVPISPEVATGDRDDVAAAWRVGLPDGSLVARGRYRGAGEPFGGEVTLSRADLGPVDAGVFVSGDRLGDFATAFVQGAAGAKTLVASVYDRAPGAPYIASTEAYKRKTRPLLRWRPGVDLWGPQTFRVLMDGAVIGQTAASELTPKVGLAAGRHVWQVEAVDRAGQTSRSRARTLKLDSVPPTLTVKVTGKRTAGQALRISVSAKDTGGSGLDHVTVDYGDHSATTGETRTRHRYRRGSFTLKVAAVDKAGNVGRRTVALRIKKS